MDRFDGFVFDLDGTVYLDDVLLPGAAATLAAVRGRAAPHVFLTNKPLERSEFYAGILRRLGLSVADDQVVSSLDALVLYLVQRAPGARVLCVSEPLVAEVLRESGFDIVRHDQAESADVVAVSFDRTFDYEKLHAAYRAVKAGARIVATNPDRFCPTADGGLPDCAAMLAAIEACTGARAEAIVGKPSRHMAAAVLDRLGLPAERVLVVGDRLMTDIALATAAGMRSALVLSGDSQMDDLEASEARPEFLLDTIAGLLDERD
ncbi:MAG TPA: HAD-IIA family hydrolase [Acidimicrobiia bacterium]|nr:HAD-IIA family hydrolase [Acidimicrobiia bacterium]